MEIQWVEPLTRGVKRAPTDCAIRISRQKAGRQTDQSVFTLYEQFMREMRLQAGDQVIVGESSSCYVIKRVQSGGYTLSPIGSDKEDRKRKHGTPCKCTVKMTHDMVKVESLPYSRDQITVTEDGLILIPKP